MNVALWVLQVLLALAIFGAGYDQATNYDSARQRMAWVAAMPRWLALVIGVLEMLAAIALIVPGLLGVVPWLTPTAALAIVALMCFAISFHVTRRELAQIAFSGTFLLVAAVVAYGRLVVSPF
jgi:uncharacterized membrane protein YphA (DoxX/SURF4 family)